MGSGIGLGLGATYLAAGMAQVASDHIRGERLAQAARGGFSETMLQREMDRMDPAALRLARAHDNFAGESGREALGREALGRETAPAWPSRLDDRLPAGRHGSALDGARELDCLTQEFSFACDGSMRHGREADAWNRARRIAERALSGVVLADVGKATHFHTTDCQPDWGPQMLRVAQVGLHVFYRFNPHAPAIRPEDRTLFVSLPLGPASGLRLATAVLEKTADATVAASGLAPQPAPSAAEPRTTGVKPPEPAASLAKTSDAASLPRSGDAAGS